MSISPNNIVINSGYKYVHFEIRIYMLNLR